jgi:hypothetical protein
MVPVRLHGDNRVMMRVTLTTPASASYSPPTPPTMAAWIQLSDSGHSSAVCSLFIDVNSQPKSSVDV